MRELGWRRRLLLVLIALPTDPLCSSHDLVELFSDWPVWLPFVNQSRTCVEVPSWWVAAFSLPSVPLEVQVTCLLVLQAICVSSTALIPTLKYGSDIQSPICCKCTQDCAVGRLRIRDRIHAIDKVDSLNTSRYVFVPSFKSNTYVICFKRWTIVFKSEDGIGSLIVTTNIQSYVEAFCWDGSGVHM